MERNPVKLGNVFNWIIRGQCPQDTHGHKHAGSSKDTETDSSNSNNDFGDLHTEEKSSELANLEIQPEQYIEKAFGDC